MFGGLLLGIPWMIPFFFFLIFMAWVPLLQLGKGDSRQADSAKVATSRLRQSSCDGRAAGPEPLCSF